jgi:hypothetical protein
VHRLALVLALTGACGKKDKAAETGSASPTQGSSAAGSGSAVVVAADAAAPAKPSGPGYELAEANVAPPTGSVAGKDPPTAESLHVEMAYALAKWAADPRDRSLYTKDFAGRDVADGRVDLVGYDEWMKQLPAALAQTRNPSVEVWLDPGTQVPAGEAKVYISHFIDGKDQYRQLLWRREDHAFHLYSEKTNSENHAETFMDLRNLPSLDAKGLGKELAARFRIENQFAWLVLENPTGGQVVVDLWPWGTCSVAEVPKGALAKLTCKDAGAGKDFVIVRDKDTLNVHLSPAGKDAPSSTDRSVDLAKGAKLTLSPAQP